MIFTRARVSLALLSLEGKWGTTRSLDLALGAIPPSCLPVSKIIICHSDTLECKPEDAMLKIRIPNSGYAIKPKTPVKRQTDTKMQWNTLQGLALFSVRKSQ